MSANALAAAAEGGAADVPDGSIGIGTLLGGGLFLAATLVWVIKGAWVSSLGFWMVCVLGMATLVIRLHEWRRFRGRNRRAV